MQETSSVSHVLDRRAGSVRNLERAILADLGAPEIGLEQRTHLSITRTRAVENSKVKREREKVDEEWNDDQAHDTSNQVSAQGRLHKEVSIAHWSTSLRRMGHSQPKCVCHRTYSTNPQSCTVQRER